MVTMSDKDVPVIKEKKGVRVGYITYIDEDYITDSEVENEKLLLDNLSLIDYSKIRSDVEYCKEQNADIIVAYVRWGKDDGSVPSTHMKDIAQYMVASGIDIVVGTGSHAVMPMEVIETDANYDINVNRKGYVFYSLGNFISNQRTGTSDMGAIATLTVRKISADSTRVVDYSVVPVYTNVDIADGRNFKVVPVEKDSGSPIWMDDTNKERYNKVYSIISSIIYSFDTTERTRAYNDL
jgi:poly-gamma-glutamate synthesis protein (capsule biosynthesis protein)